MSARRRMGPPPRVRPVRPARPAHAGRLPAWERLAFGAVFALMLAFVVVVTLSAFRARGLGPAGGSAAAGSRALPAVRTGGPGGSGRGQVPEGHAARAAWDRRLAAALAPVVAGQPGRLSVGVFNRSTGVLATYRGGRRFAAPSIVPADILAALLLRHQSQASVLSDHDERLAVQMIEAGDSVAARRLWLRAGAGPGVAAANLQLGLRHTTPGPADQWALTRTTAADQLTLLRDLAGASSPLRAGPRNYELGLLQKTAAAGRWGVSAAASPGTVAMVQAGGRRLGTDRAWVTGSIGAVEHDGQRLLLVVLSDGRASKAAAMAGDQAAAVAAAACVTSAGVGN